VLEEVFLKESEKYPEYQITRFMDRSRRHGAFSVRNFEEIFSENPTFGRKLFNFLEQYQEEEKYIRKEILFEFRN
jgi:hypothetical protein